MFRTAEWISLVLIILIIASCSAFVFRNPSVLDKDTIYMRCGNAVDQRGMSSADMKALIQECVDKSINKAEGKENDKG